MSGRQDVDRQRAKNMLIWDAIALGAALLICAYLLPELASEWKTADGGHDDGQAVSLATYKANDTFDLEDDHWWTGTLRVRVSEPLIYKNARDAGIQINSHRYDDWRVVVVDLSVENVDATCPDDIVKDLGAPALLVSMFGLGCDQDGLQGVCIGYEAPMALGVTAPGSGFFWVEQGSTERLRLAYVVIGTRVTGETVLSDGVEDYDAVSDDLEYSLTVGTGGENSSTLVKLGRATLV